MARQRVRDFNLPPEPRWRPDFEAARGTRVRAPYDSGRYRTEPGWRPAPRQSNIERTVIRISIGVFLASAVGCALLIYDEFGPSRRTVAPPPQKFAQQSPPPKAASKGDYIDRTHKSDSLAVSGYQRIAKTSPVAAPTRREAPADRGAVQARSTVPNAGALVASTWSIFEPVRETNREVVVLEPPVKAAKSSAPSAPPIRLAAIEAPLPQVSTHPRSLPDAQQPAVPSDAEARTSLVRFETAPFPYDGRSPGGRSFLNAGEATHRGHTNFRGKVLWEDSTFGDNHVLLHIPPGFDPSRPAVMVVFFHGHGAILARDIRDRQKLPAQITASGVNAVLVAPQFAVDAADSSAGKFWDAGGFKRFLDESSVQLARLYGDSKTQQAFADMPIVLVSYSGGFGPTLAVLDRGGANDRIRGLVLMDSIYSGVEKFANWIAKNRSGFFISSYTPHLAGRNSELKSLLNEKSISYSSELRRDHLRGMVAIMPAGAISHRDFVTHAWIDSPIKDVLVRMDDVDQRINTARMPAPLNGVSPQTSLTNPPSSISAFAAPDGP